MFLLKTNNVHIDEKIYTELTLKADIESFEHELSIGGIRINSNYNFNKFIYNPALG